MSDRCSTDPGATHYEGCACHEQAWQEKWKCAVEMAAQSQADLFLMRIERDRLLEVNQSAADRIETLVRTLADYIDKSEKLVYGAHGNAYLPGQMRTWLKATHDIKNIASDSPLNPLDMPR